MLTHEKNQLTESTTLAADANVNAFVSIHFLTLYYVSTSQTVKQRDCTFQKVTMAMNYQITLEIYCYTGLGAWLLAMYLSKKLINWTFSHSHLLLGKLDVPSPQNGKRTGSTFDVGALWHSLAPKDIEMIGDSSLTCQANGDWTGLATHLWRYDWGWVGGWVGDWLDKWVRVSVHALLVYLLAQLGRCFLAWFSWFLSSLVTTHAECLLTCTGSLFFFWLGWLGLLEACSFPCLMNGLFPYHVGWSLVGGWFGCMLGSKLVCFIPWFLSSLADCLFDWVV